MIIRLALALKVLASVVVNLVALADWAERMELRLAEVQRG